ncbi:MAG: hypothetical protein FWH31_02410 [Streptococcaceae bacterium]|nr:hypothetical protein [Streptococcaceae bacterium]
MSNLENFDNIFANLAESAYNGRPNSFPKIYSQITEKEVDYSQDKDSVKGGANLPNDGVVYLQPDKTLHTEDVHTNLQIPNPNGGYHTESYVTSTYQKGLLTDEKAGFNAYFVTDTPTLNADTKQAYLAVRGSDGFSIDSLNDWVANDGNFALTNSYIPQAKLANKALVSEINTLKAQAPHAVLNVTGHSLGTIVSAQAVAKLYQDHPSDFSRIGQVVLFDGPDVTQSLKNMGLTDQEIKTVGEKVTYYVNPFDMVSMLNRTAPYNEQFGKVNVIVPIHFNTTLDKVSSHDFGEFQMDTNGKPLVASKTFHPELLEAGHDLAKLIDQTLLKIEATGIAGVSSAVILTALTGGVGALVALGMTAAQAKAIYDDFTKHYQGIVTTANKKSLAWDETHIPDYQKRIRSASGSQKVELRAELLQTVAQDAMIRSEEFATEIKTELSNTLEKVQDEIQKGIQGVYNVAQHLDPWEVEALLSEFTLEHFWKTGIEEQTNRVAKQFQTEIEEFSTTLLKVAQNIKEVDANGAHAFNGLMEETRINWGTTK